MYFNEIYDIINMLQNPKGDVIMKKAIIIIVAIIVVVSLIFLLMPLFEWLAELVGKGVAWILIILIVLFGLSQGF